MSINYYEHKQLGLCTKCTDKAEKGVFCYKHWLGNVYSNIKGRCGNIYNNPKSKVYENVRLFFSREEVYRVGVEM